MDGETIKLFISLAQLVLGLAIIPAIRAVWSLNDAISELKVTIHKDFATKHDLEGVRNEIPKRKANS